MESTVVTKKGYFYGNANSGDFYVRVYYYNSNLRRIDRSED